MVIAPPTSHDLDKVLTTSLRRHWDGAECKGLTEFLCFFIQIDAELDQNLRKVRYDGRFVWHVWPIASIAASVLYPLWDDAL